MKKLDPHSFGPAPQRFQMKLAAALHEEEKPMKRKSVSALLLAAVLIIALAATALAVSLWRDTTEQVATMQAENGYFDTWTPEDRAALVLLLHENGAIADNPRIEGLSDPTLSAQEKGALSTAIMEEWIGDDAWFVTLERIAERLHGPFTTWTPEDKAWLTQLLRESGLLSGEDILYEAPMTQDAGQEDAIRIAKEALMARYDLPDGYFDGFAVNAMFHTPTWDVAGIEAGDSIWTVELTRMAHENGYDTHYVFMAELDRQGNVLDVVRNDPKSLQSDFDRMVGENGPFYMWSLEDQAAYAELLPGIIAARQAAGETIDNYMLAMSKIRYGLPGGQDMDMEAAIEAAQAYVKEHYGATDTGLAVLKPYASFDVTDSENPIWRVKMLPYKTESYEHYESTGYVVHIQARTGEVRLSLNRPQDDIGAIELL